jgi:hypothetical protein
MAGGAALTVEETDELANATLRTALAQNDLSTAE